MTISTRSMKDVMQAHEKFLAIGRQRREGRRYTGRQRRRMTRSNLKYARRPQNWTEWLAALWGKRFKYDTKPLPVSYRPWVPSVREALRRGDKRAFEVRKWWRDNLPRKQYSHLMQVYAPSEG